MARINPNPVVLVAFCTTLGLIFGAPLIGLAIALGLILLGSI